ncbi:hypothetical protein ELS19_19095 [Halogeometricum borinquense]|uniref:Uncharacterized protein n=1 Tax=Halogeometricum borinquense TaxID=60847 RepID=A0A482T392_9EURY|nr:hypothetical protein [Halogeometricum borinquense]RYJ08602.1 hypothetical protein ELS19_19095 [Halogeometricum borinquense]
MTETISGPDALARRPTRTLRLLAGLIAVEILLVGVYLLTTEAAVLSVRYVLYPFVWVNIGVLAVYSVDVPRPSGRRTAAATVVAVLYFGVLAWTTGLVGPGSGADLSVRLVGAMPGWGPILLVGGPVNLTLVPFEVVGYVCLTALVYVSLVRATAGVFSGILGLATCVSCVGPVIAGVFSGVLGGASTALAGSMSGAYAYDLSTALFVVTVGILWYTLQE